MLYLPVGHFFGQNPDDKQLFVVNGPALGQFLGTKNVPSGGYENPAYIIYILYKTYPPPGQFFSGDPDEKRFFVVNVPAQGQFCVAVFLRPVDMLLAACLQPCPGVGTLGGQIVIEMVGIIAMFGV